MKKFFLPGIVLALTALNAQALNITTQDGKVYKNVTVTNVLPNAVGFMYTDKNGNLAIRDIDLALLTKDLQKKFNYSPQNAQTFTTQAAKFQKERDELLAKHHQEEMKLLQQQQNVSSELDHIKAALYTHRIVCWIHIIRAVDPDSCIAKVAMPRSAAKFGHLGMIYIRNLTGAQNARIGATLYPTGTTKTFQDGVFPVYDADLTSYALELLQQKEQDNSGNQSSNNSRRQP
ncbi:MAG: hypothetical protein PHV59_09580 [Victivallales bacterium]|nr:hypothetical protein [Victivallales bacterium]